MTPQRTPEWTRTRPSEVNDGDWFYLKYTVQSPTGGPPRVSISMVEVRVDRVRKEIFLAQPCHDGIQVSSFGNDMRQFPESATEYSGPIPLYPG